MDEPGPTFGELLRQLRRERGLSLRAFQSLSYHSKSLIGYWENDRRAPAADVAERLDHLLDAGGRLTAAAAAAPPAAAPERIASEVVRHFAHQGPMAEEIRRRASTGRACHPRTWHLNWRGHESTIYESPRTPRGSLWSGYSRQFDDINTHARRVI